MSNGLKEKLESWLEKAPGKVEPVQAAAAALAIKSQIRGENWGDQEEWRQRAINALDGLCGMMYHCDAGSAGRLTFNAQARKEQIFIERHRIIDDGDDAGIGIPEELMPKFNSLCSTDKRQFLERAKALSKKVDPSFRELRRRVQGVFRLDNHVRPDVNTSADKVLGLLRSALGEVRHPLLMADMARRTTPKDGPKNSEEMILCAAAFLTSMQYTEQARALIGMAPTQTLEMKKAAEHILLLLLHTQDDLPSQVRLDMARNHVAPMIKEVLETHNANTDQFAGLFHYYLEHSQQRISISEHARMRAALLMLHQATNLDRARHEWGDDNHVLSPEELLSIEEASAQLHQEYEKPSADEVAEEMIAAMRAAYQGNPRSVEKNIRGFEEARASLAKGMEEVVLLHYEESEQIRELRKKLFKAQKEKFIKTLAAENAEELEAIGLTAEQIAGMGETGKIPDGSGLTVEHIIDRHHGGTNQLHNFILMSREINEAKNELKRYQINAAKDADKGCWIISWVPKKNADGTYPKIFNPGRQDGFPQPDQPEFEKLDV